MAYLNDQWQIVSWKLKKKKLKYEKDRYKVWTKFWYVWKTKDTGNRIVCYDGKILKKLDNDMYKVRFIDRYIHNSYEPFIRTVPEKIIHF